MAVTPHDLGTEKISRLLARYAFPAIIAMASVSLYNIIDSVFIGHAVGAMALSGLAISMPIMNIAAALGSMVGIGSAALISISLGEGKKERTFQILGNLVLLNTIIGLTMMVLSLLFLDDVLILFGASPDTLPYAREFMAIILGGNVVTHLYMGFNEVLRASGYPKRSMGIMFMAIVLTCVLNALFLFGFGWGVKGSAIATVLAQSCALGLQIAHFSSPKSFLHFRRGIFRLRRAIVGGILSIGIAPFLLNLCTSVVVIFVNHALTQTGGDLYVGAYGVMNRVVMFFILLCAGFNQGMQPIVGFNYGAKKYDRVIKTLKLTIMCAVCVMTVACLLGELIHGPIARLFVSSETAEGAAMIEISSHAMRLVMMVFPIVGFQIVTSNFFQYIGKPWKAVVLSTTRQLLFLVPLLWVLSNSMGSEGVWISFPIADTAASLLAAVLLFFQLKQFKQAPKEV
jgi:putative MATE family efflux protein